MWFNPTIRIWNGTEWVFLSGVPVQPSDEIYLTSHDWEEIRQLETLYLLPDERQ